MNGLEGGGDSNGLDDVAYQNLVMVVVVGGVVVVVGRVVVVVVVVDDSTWNSKIDSTSDCLVFSCYASVLFLVGTIPFAARPRT